MLSDDHEEDGAPEILESDLNLRQTAVSADDILADTKLPENQSRDAWGGKVEFLFSCLSYAVGLGNVWRFPYLCYKNGGGAFLLPFAIMLVTIGIPVMYLETCLGQYAATGPITLWKMSPLFTGVGWTMMLITFSGAIYYNMLIAWTLFYFWKSVTTFSGDLPWVTCSAEWNTGNCMHIRTLSERNRCEKYKGFFSLRHNRTCLLPNNASWQMESDSGQMVYLPADADGGRNASGYEFAPLYEEAIALNATNGSYLSQFLGSIAQPKSSSDEYFHNFVLSISNGFHDLGLPKWELVLCLLCAWIIVALILIRGIKSAGKAVYFTSLFPYMVLTILIIRGLTLEGSAQGLAYFFIPKWSRLADSKVWGEAAIQVFYSLSGGWGGIIALSSYNKFHNNAFLDALIVSVGDGLTSVYSGMTVFCVLGYMSHVMSVPIDEVGSEGAGLAFILYPDIVTSLPFSQFWAGLFFAMLLTLGFGTMIANVNTVKTALCDYWGDVFNKGHRHLIMLTIVCVVAFLFGLPCTTRGGIFVLQLMDNYFCSYAVLLTAFTELIAVTWVYGVDRFMVNVQEMRKGRPMARFWKYVWSIEAPLVILGVAVFTFISVKPSKYEGYEFPAAADALGATIAFCITLPIPIYAIVLIGRAWRKRKRPLLQLVRELAKPDREWGREMGRKPKGFYADADPAAAFESQQPLTATRSYIQSSSTVGNTDAAL